MKACTKCGEMRPRGNFYLDRGRLTAQCKFCARQYQADRRGTPTRITPRRTEQLFARGLKWCPRCRIEKQTTDFYRDKNGTHGLSGWCGKCVKEKVRKHRLTNPESYKRSLKRWKNSPRYRGVARRGANRRAAQKLLDRWHTSKPVVVYVARERGCDDFLGCGKTEAGRLRRGPRKTTRLDAYNSNNPREVYYSSTRPCPKVIEHAIHHVCASYRLKQDTQRICEWYPNRGLPRTIANYLDAGKTGEVAQFLRRVLTIEAVTGIRPRPAEAL